MKPIYKVPIFSDKGQAWGELKAFGKKHEICGTTVKCKKENITFRGHNVRLYAFQGQVYWRPLGYEVDISQVTEAEPPRAKK